MIKPAGEWSYNNVIKPAGEGIYDYICKPVAGCLNFQNEIYSNVTGAAN